MIKKNICFALYNCVYITICGLDNLFCPTYLQYNPHKTGQRNRNHKHRPWQQNNHRHQVITIDKALETNTICRTILSMQLCNFAVNVTLNPCIRIHLYYSWSAVIAGVFMYTSNFLNVPDCTCGDIFITAILALKKLI